MTGEDIVFSWIRSDACGVGLKMMLDRKSVQPLVDAVAAALADRTRDLDAARARVAELEVDKARLDFLDRCNARLNARYGTAYRWRLVLNHNVSRLMLGHGGVDLHDSDGSNTALPSCREAIDEAIRAARTAGAST